MGQISEIPAQPSQLRGALLDGLEDLDLNQEICFQSYSRVILPVDGSIFWSPLVPCKFKGSLHYSQELQQNEDETVGFATVVFTSEVKIQEFECSPINTLWVGQLPGGKKTDRFAFSQQQGLYTQAGLWHYFGHSIYPVLAAQLLDAPNSIDVNQAVVSNSMPLWLGLNDYQTVYADWFTNKITLFPSYLVQQNLVVPYGSVHIYPDSPRALAAAPRLTIDRSHYQLVADRVRVTLYGLQNDAAMDFIDCVMQYSVNSDNFGIMNMPVVMDGKRTQTELQTVAMQKHIDFEISYYQSRVASVARTLIKNALPMGLIVSTM